MKRYLGSVFWFSLVILLVGMTCRALWPASRTEAGFDTIKQQWRDSTIGLVVGRRIPVDSREPVEQAAFWSNPSSEPFVFPPLPGATGSGADAINDDGLIVRASLGGERRLLPGA